MSDKPISELPPNDPDLASWEALSHHDLALLAQGLYTVATGDAASHWVRAQARFLAGAVFSADAMIELLNKRSSNVP